MRTSGVEGLERLGERIQTHFKASNLQPIDSFASFASKLVSHLAAGIAQEARITYSGFVARG